MLRFLALAATKNQLIRIYKCWKIDGKLVEIQISIFNLPDKIAFE